MTSVAVLVPVKSSGVKSRLSEFLREDQRRKFADLMLRDVLKALAGARMLANTHVVSPDDDFLRLAESAGAEGIREREDQGVNSAVLQGVRALNPETVVVIPSDLPLLRPSEVRDFVRLKSGGVDVAIAPSQGFDGTNALAFSPRSGLALSYDNDSFWNHLASAAGKHLTVAVSTRPGLMFDVDSPRDFQALARAGLRSPSVVFARGVVR